LVGLERGRLELGNFVRPQEALNGDTPADRAGILVEGENKWKTIIQNASKKGESHA